MDEETATEGPTPTLEAIELLMQFAEADGDISSLVEDTALASLADEVCENYERDKRSREDWSKVAERALKDMARCDWEEKDYPWKGASNVHYPLLPYAVMQFNARSYPAIVKGDEAVSCKVVGADNGMPVMGPDGQPVMQVQGMPVVPTPQGPAVMTPQGLVPLPEGAQPEPMWRREPGAKAKRAARVRDYMNYQLFYRMGDWEGETDAMLAQIAAIGCAFRKVWYGGRHNSRFVPALKLVVNNDAKTLEDAPQITEEIDGVYPFHIKRDIATGKYREIDLDPEEKDARLLIEQQCHFDLDGDGMAEPYIVTVDHKERKILRVVPDFGPEQVKMVDGRVAYIERRKFYVKYEFLPHPEGKFYNIGLAHLLDQYGAVVNTIINQMIDANHAATAGGGFIGSGLRIQGQGQSSSLRFRPGEYKTVPVQGSALREGIYERTTPQLSPVMFQLLDLILGAAKDIASIKDVLSGDASNMGQVGTTLAMIEQGLQVFTAIYKRIYRGLKGEFALLFDNIAKYTDEQAARDYIELLDDPAANFETDFNGSDMDIRPISDPSSVTKMQKMARAQFLMGTVEQLAAVGGDPKEALRRVYEAADVEDIDKLLPPPDPMAAQIQQADAAATIKGKEAKAFKDQMQGQAASAKVQFDFAKLQQDGAVDAGKLAVDQAKAEITAFEAGVNAGAT
jgi:chaperonin GroES